MYGDGRNKGSVDRALREAKALDRKRKRSGGQLSGRDEARYQRVRGTASKMEDALAYEGAYGQDD